MQPDRLQSSGTLIRAHSLNRAGPGGHWLTCSLQRFDGHPDLRQAHPMSPARSPQRAAARTLLARVPQWWKLQPNEALNFSARGGPMADGSRRRDPSAPCNGPDASALHASKLHAVGSTAIDPSSPGESMNPLRTTLSVVCIAATLGGVGLASAATQPSTPNAAQNTASLQQRMHDGRGGPRGLGAGFQRILDQLNLSAEQTAQSGRSLTRRSRGCKRYSRALAPTAISWKSRRPPTRPTTEYWPPPSRTPWSRSSS